VGLSNFAAASVFGVNPIDVGIKAAKVALPKYIIAALFLTSYESTALLIMPTLLTAGLQYTVYMFLVKFAMVLAAIWAFTIANVGWIGGRALSVLQRVVFVILGGMLLIPNWLINAIGAVGLPAFYLLVKKSRHETA